MLSASAFSEADPRLKTWITAFSGKYARIVETDADLLAGNTKTTWSRNNIAQTLPAYIGVQEVSSSANFAYIRLTGLGIHTMGPWYDNAKSALLVNIPKNQKVIYRVPRTPTVPATDVNVGGSDIGCFVDGVTMFDARDAVSFPSASAG